MTDPNEPKKLEIPPDLLYTATDEWVKSDGKIATIGITDYAQDHLSDVVFIELLVSPGETVSKGQQIAMVDSVKATAEVNSPISGVVTEINEPLSKSSELINKEPYSGAWMVKIEMQKQAELADLKDAVAYEGYCKERDESERSN